MNQLFHYNRYNPRIDWNKMRYERMISPDNENEPARQDIVKIVHQFPREDFILKRVQGRPCNVCPFCGSKLIRTKVERAYVSGGFGMLDGNVKYSIYNCFDCGAAWTGRDYDDSQDSEGDK